LPFSFLRTTRPYGLLLVLLLLALSGRAQAPAWQGATSFHASNPGTYHNQVSDIAHDAAGNTYLTGYFENSIRFGSGSSQVTLNTPNSSADAFLAKFSPSGTLLWAQRAGGTNEDWGNGLAVDGSGNVYLTGRYRDVATFGVGASTTTLSSTGGDDIFLAKYDPSGAVLWAIRRGWIYTDEGKGVATDASGSVYLVGEFMNTVPGFGNTTLTSNGGTDVFVAKFDGAGNQLWVRSGGSASSDEVNGVGVDGSGNVYFTGANLAAATFETGRSTSPLTQQPPYFGGFDIFLGKYNGSGLLQWINSAGGANNNQDIDLGNALAVDASGNSHLTGTFRQKATFGTGVAATTITTSTLTDEFFLAKYDAAGTLTWVRQSYGQGAGSVNDGWDVVLDAAGNAYVTGNFGGSATFGTGRNRVTLTPAGGAAQDVFVAKYSSAGQLRWAQRGGGNDFDRSLAIDLVGSTLTVGGYFPQSATFGSTTLTGGGDVAFIAQLPTVASAAASQLLVTGTSPASQAVSAPLSAPLDITFNDAPTAASAAGIRVHAEQFGGLRTLSSATVSGSTATLQLSASLHPGELVQVSVPATVQTAGGLTAQPYVYRFNAATGGTGKGIFQGTTSVDTGTGSAVDVAVGDVDNDGDLDLVSAHSTQLVVNLNGGDATGSGNGSAFGGRSSYSIGFGTNGVVLGDIDGDGDLDLLASTTTNDQVSVRLNQGGLQGGTVGQFSAAVSVAQGATPVGLALGDVDGDGDLDLVTISNSSSSASVCLNNGSGSFGSASFRSLGSAPTRLALGDVNNDGALDLITLNPTAGTVLVCFNSGSGSFTVGGSVTLTTSTTALALGDVNGDGNLDLLALSGSLRRVYLRLNDGQGQFASGTDLTTPSGLTPLRLLPGDVDADGDMDFVLSNTNSTVDTYLNQGGPQAGTLGSFARGTTISVGSSPASLALGDMDADGDLDLFTGNSSGASTAGVSVRRNAPLAPTITGFTVNGVASTGAIAGTTVLVTGTNLYGSTTLTLNGAAVSISNNTATSFTFVVPTGSTTPGNALTVTTAGGSASSTAFMVLVKVLSTTPALHAPAAARSVSPTVTLNEAVGGSTAQNVAVFSNQAGGKKAGTASVSGSTITFDPATDFRAGEQVHLSVPATVQNTGGLGVAPFVQQFTTATGGTGRGYFTPGLAAASSANPFNVATGDVDGDGDLDLLVASITTPAVNVYLNQGGTSFASPVAVAVDATPVAIKLADFDHDGDLDFVAACNNLAYTGTGSSTQNGFVIRYNQGGAQGSAAGTFGGGTRFISGQQPVSVTVGDIDGDGDLDIVGSFTGPAVGMTPLFNQGGRQGGSVGSFVAGTNFGNGANAPQDIALTDLDNDGDLDAVQMAYVSGQAYFYLNGGNANGGGTGTFSAGSSFYMGFHPVALAAGDVDNDGDTDLLASLQGNDQMAVRFNQGGRQGGTAGDFGFASPTTTALTSPYGFVLTDVDADGDLDLAVGSGTYSQLSIRLNDGLGNFSAPARGADVAVSGAPQFLTAGDVDNDGDVDLVAVSSAGNAVNVRLNDPQPAIASFNPNPGTIGQTITLSGSGLAGATQLLINGTTASNGTNATASILNNTNTSLTFVVPVGTAASGITALTTPGGVLTSTAFTVTFGPVITSFSPASGPVGTVVTINGSNLTGTSLISFGGSSNNTVSSSFTVNATGTQITGVVVPAGASTGPISVTTAGGTASSSTSFTVTTPAPPATVTWTGAVSSDWNNPNNWSPAFVPTASTNVVIGAAANLPAVSSAVACNDLTIQAGASLSLSAPGYLTANGTVRQQGGFNMSGGTLEVKGDLFTNSTFNATGGLVTLTGSSTQHVGANGQPTTFWNLTVGAAGMQATSTIRVHKLLTLNGNLDTNNGLLVLLSDASGTAMVVNSPGIVQGQAQMQRYIDGPNAGLGYRHYSSPMLFNTVNSLATTGFTPVVNPAYNTQGNTVTPFPNVFGFDEARLGAAGTPGPLGFDQGWFSPTSTTDRLAVGRGYTVNLAASSLVAMAGFLNNGNVAVAGGLSRSGMGAYAGYHLLGNPYPSPILWDNVVKPTGLDDAVYVYRSTSQYGGSYDSYVNGVGTLAGGEIAAMQGFFVRVSQAVPSFSFTNAARKTTYSSPSFQRGAETRPLLRLSLRPAAGTSSDAAFIYFEQGATAAFDGAYDAAKLPNPNGLSLASLSGAGSYAVNGLPLFGSQPVIIPLGVEVPAAGRYELRAEQLLNLGQGTTLWLRDGELNTLTPLAAGARYAFSVVGRNATGRFALELRPGAVTATVAEVLAAQLQVYPNPAHATAIVQLPAVPGQAHATLTLLDALGRTVRHDALALPTAGLRHQLSLTGLASGVYALRVQVGGTTVTRRLVVE